MTRIMRDSVTPTDIPVAGTQLAAGYVNGAISEWPAGAWNRFPDAVKVTIDVMGTAPTADVLDVENGDATPATAVEWVKAKKALNGPYPPIVYSSRAGLTPLFNALNAAGLEVERDFRTWIATLDGAETVADMTGVTAVQYQGQDQTGGHYDQSLVYDNAWKAAVGPTLPPPTSAVLVVLPSGTTKTVTSTDGEKTWQ